MEKQSEEKWTANQTNKIDFKTKKKKLLEKKCDISS